MKELDKELFTLMPTYRPKLGFLANDVKRLKGNEQ